MIYNEDTLILPTLETKVVSRAAFRGFLVHYGLSIRQVAPAAGVPKITIWSIDRGNAVLASYEHRVRWGLYRLTGITYTAPIAVLTRRDRGNENKQNNGQGE